MTVMAVSTDTTAFRFGTQSLKVTTGDTGSNALYPSVDSVVVPGQSYSFSCYVKTTGALTGGSVRLDVCAGGTITPALFSSGLVSDSSTFADVVNGWTRLSVVFVPASGTLLVRPVLKYTGATLGQIFWVDGIKFEPGILASTWAQNIVSKQLVLDQGAVQVDAKQGGLLRFRGSTGGSRDTISLGTNGFLFGGDTEVYSPSAGELKLAPTAAQDKTLTIETASAKLALLNMQATGDTNPRIQLQADGAGSVPRLVFGPGNAAIDTTLYRSAADLLATDDVFRLGLTSITAAKINVGGASYDNTAHGIVVGDSVRAKPVTPVGWAMMATPPMFQPTGAYATSAALPINGGSCATPINVPAPMKLVAYLFKNLDTTLTRTAEFRLYYADLNNTATVKEVAGSAATISFVAAAVSNQRATLTGGDIILAPGTYWLVTRNTSAANTFGLALDGTAFLTAARNNATKTLAGALGTTLDLVTGWTLNGGMVAVIAQGRMPDGTTLF